MGKTLQSHTINHDTIGGPVSKTYKLMDCGTFYMIKVFVNDEANRVFTGKASYINRLWNELTKKKAYLK